MNLSCILLNGDYTLSGIKVYRKRYAQIQTLSESATVVYN